METLREILTNNSEIILDTGSEYVTGEGLLNWHNENDGEDDSILDTGGWWFVRKELVSDDDEKCGYKVIDDEQLKGMFEEVLNDAHGPFEIDDMLFSPSSILKNCNPIAYREKFASYKNGLIEEL